jgi:ABC-type spermidine/putrescine transport system permease subunit II
MNEGLSVLIGLSIAYVASFLGMLFAYIAYRRRQRERASARKEDRHA